MKVGLVGFGGCGKSSVFAALTGSTVAAGKSSLGSIRVPDGRVDELARMWSPRKTTYAEIFFEDFAPGAFGAGQASLPAATIGAMRTLDVLAEVVDAFSGAGLAGVAERTRAFREELQLADLAVVEKRLDRLTRERGRPGESELLAQCRAALEDGRELRELDLGAAEQEALSGFQFLTLKPRLVVANVGEGEAAGDPTPLQAKLAAFALDAIVLCASLEQELAQLPAEDRSEFLAGYGLSSGAGDRFIGACYRMLDLITFLTAGEDEVRAWPIVRGTTAVGAAGKVHSDIARGFIRAEVIAYDDYIALGGESACRQAGKLRMQGKDYIVNDGDVVHFRFNV